MIQVIHTNMVLQKTTSTTNQHTRTDSNDTVQQPTVQDGMVILSEVTDSGTNTI